MDTDAEPLEPEDMEWLAGAIEVLNAQGYEVTEVAYVRKEHGGVKFDFEMIEDESTKRT